MILLILSGYSLLFWNILIIVWYCVCNDLNSCSTLSCFQTENWSPHRYWLCVLQLYWYGARCIKVCCLWHLEIQIRSLYLEILHEVWSKAVRDLTHFLSYVSACDAFSFFAALMFFICHYFYVFCIMVCLRNTCFQFYCVCHSLIIAEILLPVFITLNAFTETYVDGKHNEVWGNNNLLICRFTWWRALVSAVRNLRVP
jgi:hypothetical protein